MKPLEETLGKQLLEALTRAGYQVIKIEQPKDSQVCPFLDPTCELNFEDPCPVCGDTGLAEVSHCIDYIA